MLMCSCKISINYYDVVACIYILVLVHAGCGVDLAALSTGAERGGDTCGVRMVLRRSHFSAHGGGEGRVRCHGQIFASADVLVTSRHCVSVVF